MTILRYEDYANLETVDTEVLVIGTGAGGAAAGATLAEAGVEVTFVEEGAYHPTSSFSPTASESIPRLYRDAGATVILGRAQIPYIEGRAVGGTTVINGGMAYRAPDDVLASWQRLTGSEDLGVAGMEPYFDAVEDSVSARHQADVSIGNDNRLMAQGARRMGWKVVVNRRNQRACVGANSCVFGCPTGAKQSTLVTYIPRALAAGARCLTQLRVTKLLIERGRCVGAIARAVDPRTQRDGRRVVLRAKSVIVACGAVQTPRLLLRHRLGRPSRQLGRNFLCHPNVKVLAVYPGEVNAWQGVSQWCQIREFHEEGILFAENFVPPTGVAARMPYDGPDAWELMQRYNHMVMSGVLVEDSTTGTVTRGPFGVAVPRYDITDYDHERFIRGARLLAQMHFEMGAERVLLPFHNLHEARTVDDLAKLDPKRQTARHLDLFTVHLMGTARMGSDEQTSVVDLDGQLWDLPGCYVADASLFPTAIGVNPQITIMALALRIAHRMIDSGRVRVGATHRQETAGERLSA
ncbi:MAG: GMC family oxidoreductase N-terminal domain-containing protein [Myxococcales bacterium]|nr:GMC family oxidoreductase N-terminal domain-containing protein [Myxococcales bacterium]